MTAETLTSRCLEEEPLDNASYYGRIFARSGGLTDAVRQGLKEHGYEDFDFNPVACDGIEECRMALLKASKGVLNNNFIEGMACMGGLHWRSRLPDAWRKEQSGG